MPKVVDHHERRERIAAGLVRVAGARGLEGISLRHVAAECGVTAGMVQHYFPTKAALMAFAMDATTTRYGNRMAAAAEALGDDPRPVDLVRAVLMTFLPLEESERPDARVALAMLSYASTRPTVAAGLGVGTRDLREFLAAQVRRARTGNPARTGQEPDDAATGLLAMVEGLAIHVVSSDLAPQAAVAALDAQLAQVFGST